MTMSDEILLRKRSIIETVNDELKNICQIEHSRHRNFANFLSNIVAGIIAYSFLSKKTFYKTSNNQNKSTCFLLIELRLIMSFLPGIL